MSALVPLDLHIDGMSCGHCLNAVNRALAGLPGLRILSVAMGRARLEYDPAATDPGKVIAAIGAAGYQATPIAA